MKITIDYSFSVSISNPFSQKKPNRYLMLSSLVLYKYTYSYNTLYVLYMRGKTPLANTETFCTQ